MLRVLSQSVHDTMHKSVQTHLLQSPSLRKPQGRWTLESKSAVTVQFALTLYIPRLKQQGVRLVCQRYHFVWLLVGRTCPSVPVNSCCTVVTVVFEWPDVKANRLFSFLNAGISAWITVNFLIGEAVALWTCFDLCCRRRPQCMSLAVWDAHIPLAYFYDSPIQVYVQYLFIKQYNYLGPWRWWESLGCGLESKS